MGSGPVRPLVLHPHGVLAPRRESDDRDRLLPAASPAPTVPNPSGRDRAELVGTPLLRLLPPRGVPSVTTADLGAPGPSAELQFGDSAMRYSHADWAREQRTEPACRAAMRSSATADGRTGRTTRFPQRDDIYRSQSRTAGRVTPPPAAHTPTHCNPRFLRYRPWLNNGNLLEATTRQLGKLHLFSAQRPRCSRSSPQLTVRS